jgi:8-oxo-dGTP diphosphatase
MRRRNSPSTVSEAFEVDMKLSYTLCFLLQGECILMLNRKSPPNMGLWNGLGGKIEPGESPHAAALREVREEADLALADARFAGVVTWTSEKGSGGMYVFLARLADDISLTLPRETEEGVLSWKPLAWILDPNNLGVVSNIPRFLPMMLERNERYRFHCRYDRDQLVGVEMLPLASDLCAHV